MKIVKLSLKELGKKRFFSILMILVCIFAIQTVLSAVTNAVTTTYQQKIFKNNIGVDMKRVLHLSYQSTEETPEFAGIIRQYLDDIRNIPGVEAVGQFDMMGVYFSELEAAEEYKKLNEVLLKGQKYENHPTIARLLSVDEEMLSFIKGGITRYKDVKSGFLPLYASESFKGLLPVGTILTNDYTGDKYEIVGYIPKGTQWADENDSIRYPMISLDGWFVAPFTEASRSDIMTQLSALHNTYVQLSGNADIDTIKTQISSYAVQHGFEASAISLSEEYEMYRLETEGYTRSQTLLAVFLSVMAISSIIAVFATNALLKKKQYGILIANGFTLLDIAAEIAAEIFIILVCSGGIAWLLKWKEFNQDITPCKTLLLEVHAQYTLPVCVLLIIALTVAAAWIPTIKVFKYQPCELIGGDTNGCN